MTRDRPLLALIATAGASYPAVALGWCVTALLGAYSHARELWLDNWLIASAVIALVIVGAVAIGNATYTLARGVWQTYRLHRLVADRRVPGDSNSTELGADSHVRIVESREQLALTVGLWRPYIVVSCGLLTSVSPAELRAIVTHEQAHVRRRDPLRLLAGRVLAAHLWFVPLAADLRHRARRGYELAADRHAVRACGQAAVAGALLRVGTAPSAERMVAAQFTTPELLEARVSQLETGRAPQPAAVRKIRAAGTATISVAFLAAVAGAWVFMLLACPCATGMGMV